MAKPQQRETGNIKILSIVWYKVLPPRFGGQKAVAMFNHHLAKLAPLICLCSKNNVPNNDGYEVRSLLPVSKWQFLNPFVWRRVYAIAKREKVTHLILEFPYHGIIGFICKKLLGVCLITNTHNIEYERFREQKKWWWGPLFHFEKWTLKQSDLIFFKTGTDHEMAIKHFALTRSACEVIPYGADCHPSVQKLSAKEIIRKRHQINDHEALFLFAGTLDYLPNADAVIAIHQKLIPLLNKTRTSYKVLICGRNQKSEFTYVNSLRNERLITVGEVADIDLYFQAADVFLDPVLTGGGVQTKIIDALCYNVNVVAFRSKCQEIRNAGSKLSILSDGDWESFATAVIRMIDYKEPTPPEFFETYHWPAIAGRAYLKMIAC